MSSNKKYDKITLASSNGCYKTGYNYVTVEQRAPIRCMVVQSRNSRWFRELSMYLKTTSHCAQQEKKSFIDALIQILFGSMKNND